VEDTVVAGGEIVFLIALLAKNKPHSTGKSAAARHVSTLHPRQCRQTTPSWTNLLPNIEHVGFRAPFTQHPRSEALTLFFRLPSFDARASPAPICLRHTQL